MANIPRYHKLALLLTEKITSGEYKPGDRFFSQTELMKKFALSFATVTRALKELELQGYLVREQGRGTFVKSIEKDASSSAAQEQVVNVFIPWDSRTPSHINYRTLYRGMENSRPKFIQLRLIPYSMNPDDLEPFLFTHEQVGGVVFVYPEAVHIPLINKFARQHPAVVIGGDIAGDNIGCVWSDNKLAADQAVQHLIDLGHRSIGIISAPLSITDAAERLDGYHEALRRNGLKVSESAEIFTHPIELNGFGACMELLERHPDMTAVFAAGDVIAMGVFAATKAVGRSVPNDLSVVGFDDTDYAVEMVPPLTTIHVPYEDMACRAIEILATLIQTGKAVHECLPANLVVRSSTARVPVPSKSKA